VTIETKTGGLWTIRKQW